jgi:hypothetical protein
METTWSNTSSFLKGFYENKKDKKGGDSTSWNCFKAMYDAIGKLNTN